MQRNKVCKNTTEYYTLDEIDEIDTEDLIYIKLDNNIFCLEKNSYENMIKLAIDQRVRGQCKRVARGRPLDCKWFYPVLAAPLIFITEESYRMRKSDITANRHGKYYELTGKKVVDFTTGLHQAGEKTGKDNVYNLTPAKFKVDPSGNNVIMQSTRRRSPTPQRRSQPRSPSPGADFRRRVRNPSSLTVYQLKKICKEKGVRRYSTLRKAELIRRCVTNAPQPRLPHTLTVKELKRICKEKGIRVYSTLRKAELIEKCG